jgi:hypothetical protein
MWGGRLFNDVRRGVSAALAGVVGVAGVVVGCNASLSLLDSDPAPFQDGPETSTDGGSPEGGEPSHDSAASDAGALSPWPFEAGTVVEIARGLSGAADIDVDENYVYVAVDAYDGGVYQVPKQGGTPVPVAVHQPSPSSVRVTPVAVVWSLQPGVSDEAPSIMRQSRDGGAPVPFFVGGWNAGSLAAEGNTIAWVDGRSGGRIMVADLVTGTTKPIVTDVIGLGGVALSGDRVAWTALCYKQCGGRFLGGFVGSSPLSQPAPAEVWSTHSNVTMGGTMGGLAIHGDVLAFGFFASGAEHFASVTSGVLPERDYPGNVVLASPVRNDGDSFVALSVHDGLLSLLRIRADGTASPTLLTSSPGTSGATVPDAHAIYWIEKTEGVLRAITR